MLPFDRARFVVFSYDETPGDGATYTEMRVVDMPPDPETGTKLDPVSQPVEVPTTSRQREVVPPGRGRATLPIGLWLMVLLVVAGWVLILSGAFGGTR